MGRDVLSFRQMTVLLLVALLTPVTDLLPSLAAQRVGRGGWLVAPLVLPVLLLAMWLCSKVFCGCGLGERVGKSMEYTITIIYTAWILFLLALVFRSVAARMELIHNRVPPICFSAGVAVLSIWAGRGKTAALARAAEVFYLVLTVVLAGVLLLALFHVEWSNLHPVEWARIPGGSILVAGILLNVAPIAVLGARVPRELQNKGRGWGWAVAFCAEVTLVLMAVFGNVGSRLSARLDAPYFIMVQGLGVKGAFQRLEAPVAALWLLSDLILAGMLLRAGNDYVTEMTSERWGRRSVPIMVLVALGVGWMLFPEDAELRGFCVDVLPVAGVILGLVIPFFLWVISCVRQKKQG